MKRHGRRFDFFFLKWYKDEVMLKVKMCQRRKNKKQVPMLKVLHFAICNKNQIDHYKCTHILCVSKCNGKFGDYLLLNSIAIALNTSSFFCNVHDECSSFLDIVFFKRISFYFECLNWRFFLFFSFPLCIFSLFVHFFSFSGFFIMSFVLFL